MKRLFPLVLAAFLVAPSSPAPAKAAKDPLAPVTSRGTAAEKRFSAVVSEYARGLFAFAPSFATGWGIHAYDDKLQDSSKPAIDREVARARRTIAAAKGIDLSQLSDSARIDYDFFLSQVEGHVFDLTEIRRWENDPSDYNYAGAIFSLAARNYAPPEERLRHVIARLGQVPRLLAAGKANVKNPPALFANFAAEDFQGTIDFLETEVPVAFEAVKDAALWSRYNAAKKTAEDATRDYMAWIQNELVPRAKGSYVLGPEKYAKKLHYDEMVDVPLDELLRVGQQELDRLEARYADCAKRIDPSATPEQLLERMRRDHPTAAELIPYTKGLLDEIRSYSISSHFCGVPSEVRCIVRPTPSFEASRSFASLDAPGPFETKASEAYYNITTPRADWDSARVDQHLQGYSRWMLPTTSIHEAYPGHYVNFLWAKRAPGLVRQTMGCGSFGEGWALYAEEAMIDHGYKKDDPRVEFGMLRWALVRACRFQVGIRLHTKGMTMDDAIALFVNHAHMEKANAEREAYRAAFDPTYIVYTLGALQIRKLREDVMKAEGTSFELARFHERMLTQGALPVSLLRRMMLHDSGPSL
ncbi:MAG TPA: DUF885 domain-containing protein [Candidatus Saccharimonadales bacterium]|nr:DUF885 domain-containing protein [Candidatus Saccharimonadales bacterium]